jgi:hypothetical protein
MRPLMNPLKSMHRYLGQCGSNANQPTPTFDAGPGPILEASAAEWR